MRLLAKVGMACLALGWLCAEAAGQIQVKSADPNMAPQGTIGLSVTITGSGFKRGAKSTFYVSGTTNPGGVVVKSTQFVDSTHLVATIDVATDAVVSNYDILVANADGRTGKGTELFGVTQNTGQAPSIARVSFASSYSSVDVSGSPVQVPYAMRSDGRFQVCGFDYVDKSDTCTGLFIPNDAQAASSTMLTGNSSFFRPIAKCCSGDPVWDPWIYSPTRWVVLDFSNSGGKCLNIDQTIFTNAANNGSGATPPLNPDACVDYVEVRIKADQVFTKTTKSTSFSVAIDEPQLHIMSGGGTRTDWNVVYTLQYVKRVSVTHNADGTATVVATGSSAQAQLLDGNNVVLGTYNLPFSMTLKQVQ